MSTSFQVPRISGEQRPGTRSPILVTGAPRSGTTFLGTMLSLNRDVSYIYEPMSRSHGLRGIPSPLLYVRSGSRNEDVMRRMTREMLAGRGSFRRPSTATTSSISLRSIARRMIGSGVSSRYRTQVLNPMRRRWLLKDPWAAFASEWLHREIGIRTVVIVRHPVPTVLSYRRLGWDFQVEELTTMDELMADHLTQMLGGIDLAALSQLERAALVWRIYYHVLGRYIDRNPDMIVLRHEDLCADPMNVLRGLYAQLDLRFDARVRKQVVAYTSEGNLVDGTARKLHQLQRDSAAVATTWRSKVDSFDLATIRTWTEPESARWYAGDDW